MNNTVSEEIDSSQDELAASLDQISSVEAIDETLLDINTSLARQISEELEHLEAGL